MASIIFGWYTTKIKSYTPEDLELDYSHPHYQVRQRIFHIMYIPIIPIGKVYVFKQDKKFYKAPEIVKKQIKERKDYRTPWYSLFIPFLAVIGALLAVSVYFYSGWKNEHDADVYYANKIEQNLNKLTQLKETDYLELENLKNINGGGYYILKVQKVKGNQIVFLKSNEKIFGSEPAAIVRYFKENADSLEKVSISINRLKKMIPKDRSLFKLEDNAKLNSLYDSIAVNVFNDGEKYILNQIKDYNSPFFSVSTIFPSKDEMIGLKIKNIGEPVKLIAIKGTEGNIKPETEQLQEIISTDNNLIVNVKTNDKYQDFVLELTFSNLNAKKMNYLIKKYGNAVKIQNENDL